MFQNPARDVVYFISRRYPIGQSENVEMETLTGKLPVLILLPLVRNDSTTINASQLQNLISKCAEIDVVI
jgi:hypothetical protein